jgi:hypothetical protein
LYLLVSTICSDVTLCLQQSAWVLCRCGREGVRLLLNGDCVSVASSPFGATRVGGGRAGRGGAGVGWGGHERLNIARTTRETKMDARAGKRVKAPQPQAGTRSEGHVHGQAHGTTTATAMGTIPHNHRHSRRSCRGLASYCRDAIITTLIIPLHNRQAVTCCCRARRMARVAKHKRDRERLPLWQEGWGATARRPYITRMTVCVSLVTQQSKRSFCYYASWWKLESCQPTYNHSFQTTSKPIKSTSLRTARGAGAAALPWYYAAARPREIAPTRFF